MKFATWNVNSVKARIETVTKWLADCMPDVVALQEIKCTDDTFPRGVFEDLGYNCAVHGQKTYNGVALLSRRPLEDVSRGLAGGDGDEQSRYIEAVVPCESGTMRVASIYLPNGNPLGSEKFSYKLAWMERLHARAGEILTYEEPAILMGDFNVIPTDEDCHDPAVWASDALFQPQSKQAFRKLEHMGYQDAFRACDARPHRYTFWDYQAGSWQKDHGIRIDFQLLSPQAADRLKSCTIDKRVRGWDKPSDHVPVITEIDI
ncbi:exodeoxyribonuclease-3 [Rhizomicrobium palustre]|uniref:Exodeoxyribonuclease-3 n=1 Tax=Rhizomicrobium palustre TaxID=189966 RepID=A0A846N5C9_9PROT|nr:exodeoxyribonuclease III [Rhizomicrobium palustre]NIK90210.1 exodeoxyribonuclease-3 [Rhizomicrobium palustre]